MFKKSGTQLSGLNPPLKVNTQHSALYKLTRVECYFMATFLSLL